MEAYLNIVKIQWIIIAMITVLIGLLIFQNIHLKFSSNDDNHTHKVNKSLIFEQKIKKNFQLKKFPFELVLKDFYFQENHKREFVDNYLIMVFDLTVCGKCLHEGLATLKHFQERIESRNVGLLAIAGIANTSEESEIINLYSSGEMPFPCKTMSVDELYKEFELDKEHFLDTPFFIYTSHQFKVLDIFKPELFETKELRRWLKILADQDIL